MKQHILSIGSIAFSILLLIMIAIGADGKALKPKQAVFTFAKNSRLSNDAADYLKGVVDESRVTMDLSNVDTHITGTYEAKATQSSRTYTFLIKIE